MKKETKKKAPAAPKKKAAEVCFPDKLAKLADKEIDKFVECMKDWNEPDGFFDKLSDGFDIPGLGQNYGGLPAAPGLRALVKKVKAAVPGDAWAHLLRAHGYFAELIMARFGVDRKTAILINAIDMTNRWSMRGMRPHLFVPAAAALDEADEEGWDVYGEKLGLKELRKPGQSFANSVMIGIAEAIAKAGKK